MQGRTVNLGMVDAHGVVICHRHTVNFMIEVPWIGLETICQHFVVLQTFQSGRQGRCLEEIPEVVGKEIAWHCLRLTTGLSIASLFGFIAFENCRGSSESIE
jgi:hypothetical protein